MATEDEARRFLARWEGIARAKDFYVGGSYREEALIDSAATEPIAVLRAAARYKGATRVGRTRAEAIQALLELTPRWRWDR